MVILGFEPSQAKYRTCVLCCRDDTASADRSSRLCAQKEEKKDWILATPGVKGVIPTVSLALGIFGPWTVACGHADESAKTWQLLLLAVDEPWVSRASPSPAVGDDKLQVLRDSAEKCPVLWSDRKGLVQR